MPQRFVRRHRNPATMRTPGRAARTCLLALAALTPLAALAAPSDDPLAELRRLRERITTLQATATLTVEDRPSAGPARSESRVIRILYDRASGRMRRELVSFKPLPGLEGARSRTGTGATRSEDRQAVVVSASVPEPAWLFGLPEEARAFRMSQRSENRRTLVLLRARGRLSNRAEKDVLLDGEGLPIRVRSFGNRNEVLDEATIRWQRSGGQPFPLDITLVQRSRLNVVTTTLVFTGVRVNATLAATLFEAP